MTAPLQCPPPRVQPPLLPGFRPASLATRAFRAEGEAATWRGTVAEIPDSVTGRKLKPQDPARPTDTRILLVKVALASHEGLKLGRRVEVEIEAR